MRLRALLDTDALGLKLLGGEEELDRTVRGVMTTDLRDPSRYLSGGELVLTGLAWRHDAEDSEPFVRILVQQGVTALAAGEAELGDVPADLVTACARHRLPLFAVHESVAFATITEHVVRQVSGERAGDLAAVVDRHRRMMTSGPAGGGPDVVLDLLGSDLDLRAWVLAPTGRLIAGSKAAGPAALPAETCGRLVAEHLTATRTGRRAPHRVLLGGTTYSLFPIRSTGRSPQSARDTRDVRETLLSDWLLAVEADAGDWAEERLDLLHGVTQLIAVERDRRDAARTVRRRLAQEVLELVQTGAAPGEIAARLRVAAPVLLPGLGAAPHWQVVVARVDWDGDGIEGGPVAQALLEEILVDPLSAGPEHSDRIAVAHTGEEAIALVPLPAVSTEHDGSETGVLADALLESVRDPLTAGLDGDGHLTLGVSAAVHSAEGLRGALEEARHARRVAAARPGRVCAAGHQELASHVLLLPFVPDDVRRAFTARLLDPLRDYDRRHRAELIPTLEAFLDCDGSWTRCAGRLHLHVNTLRYRVGRIEQLTGRDLSRLEDKLDFFLALRMS
ncbi:MULTISPECIES: PucR family transcriptional regulator ligand-binding domain-containing protein [Streptomyces]|uniref:PucR family transcriptional regulator ligand-binding domain-containing protein n=1 Tax=Streptomyces koelreuteriae TaxID=2838015 RepID=A0ABX8FM75_9ACTN|nr:MULTISPECIES: PucR family transcriptional regulator ligand-binding domain-containing protein [Streptomyces]QWB22229.1 PucR family transcriptional regulator ligand-binding domain-containing protein [Streptomyces koelreuteriae]UUA05171.1 PucR family transcriptional regulator ligand-binding domain-containing protein [Streptomyces koelreuteriae]UUA12796.1 PucR family transcriptional regulator ligand-binding domain-containing protein [Streptomyces sp. CRCS-T-1]